MSFLPNKMIVIILASLLFSACTHHPQQAFWRIDSTHSLNDLAIEMEGNPKAVSTPYGDAVVFDGEGDRLLVHSNPLDGASEFTIEIIFNPADAFPNNWEPRFFHIEAADNPNRRVTIELRLNDKQQWYLDTYIKSELSQLTLIDEQLVHPVSEWAHAAITYKNRQFEAFVNGKKELSGQVDYLPIAAKAQTSIGARMNRVHWFKGAILAARVTHSVLSPAQFLQLGEFKAK